MAKQLQSESNSDGFETTSSEDEFYDATSSLKGHAAKVEGCGDLNTQSNKIDKESIPSRLKGGYIQVNTSQRIDCSSEEARCRKEDETTEKGETELDNDNKLISPQINDKVQSYVQADNIVVEDVVHEGLAAEASEPDGDEAESVVKETNEDGEDALRQLEETLTEGEKEEKREKAQNFKKEGNDLYKNEEYVDSIDKYTEALKCCPLCFKKERSIMFANRAASKIHMKQLDEGVCDCTKALDLHPQYLKVLLRRAQTYELLEKLEDALADYQKALELDQGCHLARAACMRLPDEINEKNEKLKVEMMDKLKDLGNLVLRPFGLSTNNFQMQQDPNTGSYSVNFVQNSKTGNGQ